MPAFTCSEMRADVKKPSAMTTAMKSGTACSGLNSRRDDVVPEEDLDQQRDVAEELRPRVADPHERLDRRRAQDAHQRADRRARRPASRRTRAASSPTPTSSSRDRSARHRCPGRTPASPNSSRRLPRRDRGRKKARRGMTVAALSQHRRRRPATARAGPVGPIHWHRVLFHRLVVRVVPRRLGGVRQRQTDLGVGRRDRLP